MFSNWLDIWSHSGSIYLQIVNDYRVITHIQLTKRDNSQKGIKHSAARHPSKEGRKFHPKPSKPSGGMQLQWLSLGKGVVLPYLGCAFWWKGWGWAMVAQGWLDLHWRGKTVFKCFFFPGKILLIDDLQSTVYWIFMICKKIELGMRGILQHFKLGYLFPYCLHCKPSEDRLGSWSEWIMGFCRFYLLSIQDI